MPRVRARLLLVACVAACVATAMASCSRVTISSGGSQNNAPGVDAKAKTIKVGTSAPMTGNNAYYGQIADAVKAYFSYLNSHGGVDGWKIQVKLLDDQYSPTVALSNSRQLVQDDQVFAMVSSVGSDPDAASAPYLSEQNVTVLPDTGQASLNKYKNFFSIEPASGSEAGLDTAYAIEHLHKSRIGVIYEQDALGTPALQGIKAVAKKHGKPIVAAIPEPVSATDFGPAVAKLEQKKADAVLIWGANAWFASILRAAQTLGYKPAWFGPFYIADPATYKLAGDLMAGTYFGSWVEPVGSSSAEMRRFTATMHKQYPHDSLGAVSSQGWAVAATFVTALRKVIAAHQEITEANVQNALNHFRNTDVPLTEGVTFDKAHRQWGGSGEVIVQAAKGGRFNKVSGRLPFPPEAVSTTYSQ